MTARSITVLLLVWAALFSACADRPQLEGDWEGVAATSAGPSFYYTITLDETSETEVLGTSGISVYATEGTGADSTFSLDVTGMYRFPDVTLTITGPFPSETRPVSATFVGAMSPDGEKIEGTLSSAITGDVELNLERIERE